MVEHDSPSRRAKRVRLLILDVDGVLTDGRVYIAPDGSVTKRFDIHDGHAIVLMRELLDFPVAVISGRDDKVTQIRCEDLGIGHIVQGVREKVVEAERIAAEVGCSLDEVAFMGDDINDLPLLRKVGLAAAPANACAEALEAAHYRCEKSGGAGAVRELCELILKARGQWERLLNAMA